MAVARRHGRCEGGEGRPATTVIGVNSEADQRNGERLSLVLRGSSATCRVQPWSFRPEVAQLVMYQQQQLPAVADLHRWSDRLRDLGYTSVRTTALATAAGLRVESAGFHSIQELVLLEHTRPTRARAAVTTRRLRDADHDDASAIDVAAFGSQWALETSAIAAVCAATPRHRGRAVGVPLAAYAISGRDAKQGFLQRLAVHPAHQRQGLGRALVVDSLQWLARWRVQRVLVNTPVDNDAALALYEGLGFQRLTEHLRLYERELA